VFSSELAKNNSKDRLKFNERKKKKYNGNLKRKINLFHQTQLYFRGEMLTRAKNIQNCLVQGTRKEEKEVLGVPGMMNTRTSIFIQ